MTAKNQALEKKLTETESKVLRLMEFENECEKLRLWKDKGIARMTKLECELAAKVEQIMMLISEKELKNKEITNKTNGNDKAER